MINIQKDIIDRCRVILRLIDIIYENSEDITVYVKRTDKIKNLSSSIGKLMVKFEELGSAINKTDELERVYSVIRLFEKDIPKIREVIEKYKLPEQVDGISLANVRKNLQLLEGRIDTIIDDIRVNLKVLNTVVIKEKVPEFSGLMGRLHGEEVIDDVQKAALNEDAKTIIMQINESCNNVITDLNNVITLTMGAINYIAHYFELLSDRSEVEELSTLFDIIRMKQEKVVEALVT